MIRSTALPFVAIAALVGAATPAGIGAQAADQVLAVAQDTWIHGLESSSGEGENPRLSICPVANYWIYLRFDLRAVEGDIEDAELRLNRFDGGRPEEISVYFIPDDDWSETLLTGTTRPDPRDPSPGEALGTGEEAGDFDRWRSDALTGVIREELRGDGTLTLMLREDPDDRLDVRHFYSREGAPTGIEAPRLAIASPPPDVVHPDWKVVDVGEGTKPSFDFGPGTVEIMGMTEEQGGEVWHATARSVEGPFVTQWTDTGYFYGPGDLRADAVGQVYVAWHNHDAEDPDLAVYFGHGVFEKFTVDTPGNHNGWDNSLALDAEGRLHMASVDPVAFGATDSLEYGVFDGEGWNFGTVPGSGAFMYGLATSIAVDRRGDPHIVYCLADDWTSPGELRYAVRRDGDGWRISTVIGGPARGRFPTLALDHWDRPHVAWLDGDTGTPGAGHIRYAVLNNEVWEVEDVDTLENVRFGFSDARRSVSLALDGSWRPHVAYGDERRLKYAVKPFGAWNTVTVLESGREALKGLAVLRLDRDDAPAIAFWEVRDGTGWVRLASSFVDCNSNGTADDADVAEGRSADCNANAVPDECDIEKGTSSDGDGDGVPDECAGTLFHRGDPDASGAIDISDAVFLFSYLFLGGLPPPCLESADADNDGTINLTDGIYVLGYLFTGGPAPVMPGPDTSDCGPDIDDPGSDRDLGCEAYEGC